jgi:hypothetical protein
VRRVQAGDHLCDARHVEEINLVKGRPGVFRPANLSRQ